MQKDKQLEIGLAKLRPFSDTKQWCAYLSYAEIIALDKNGYREKKGNEYRIDDIKEEMEHGINGSTWVYYVKIGKNKPHYNRPNKE